ncbi:MAG: apiosidase-like domain-containing protein [Thermoguttaceae bacterium]
MHRRNLVRLAAALAAALAVHAEASPAPHVWQRWEHTLTSTRPYDNPYADVTLRVRYTGPGGRTLETFGFWDGDNQFRIRCAFPSPGLWKWQTECSDPADSGLHRRQGTVEVTPAEGDNVLDRRGFLKVGPNRRYLVFDDGTPFLWMGDTAWAAPMLATDSEWDVYLRDRAAKHFTLIQVAPAPQWAGQTDRAGQRPFFDQACTKINPAFWQAFDRKIHEANRQGFVVLLVGLMEPVHRYPDSAAACLFARHIIARLYGNFVIFSPSFDSKFMPLADEVGLAARQATAVHLLTQHPGTPSREPIPIYTMEYYDRPYLDIAGVQTGHNGGDRRRCAHHAVEWILHAWRHEPHKPVVNLEAMYDGQGERAWQAVDARSLAWRSWLSGAKGYTYGAGDVPPKCPQGSGGVWKWVTDPDKPDYWRKALQWESSLEMQVLHDLLASTEWWNLEPAHELILNQPDDVTRRMVLAHLPERDFAIGYLPGDDPLDLDLSKFSTPLTARWFDPVTGRSTPVPGTRANRSSHRFQTPAPGDWVLILEASNLPNMEPSTP